MTYVNRVVVAYNEKENRIWLEQGNGAFLETINFESPEQAHQTALNIMKAVEILSPIRGNKMIVYHVLIYTSTENGIAINSYGFSTRGKAEKFLEEHGGHGVIFVVEFDE